MVYYIYNKKEIKYNIIREENNEDSISCFDDLDEDSEDTNEDPDLELFLRSEVVQCRCFFEGEDDEKGEEWSDHRRHLEAEKLGLNFKLKNKIERNFYEDQIIKDKYKNLETYERSMYHHRSRYTYGGNAELNFWEKDKNYLIRSWEELKQEFFNTHTVKQKHSHLKAFEHTMKYKPIKFTGRYKKLNKELRNGDNEHLMKMKAEIKHLIESD